AARKRTELEIARREYLPGLSHLDHSHLCWMHHHVPHSVCPLIGPRTRSYPPPCGEGRPPKRSEGGRGGGSGWSARFVLQLRPPPPPHKGEGSRPSLPHERASDHHTPSISMAPPWPPPMHSVAMPCLTPSRFIALTRCSTMRLPLAPTGWPSPMAPPSTLSLSRGLRPPARSSPSTSRQNVSSSQAARQASTCAATAPLTSHRPMSLSASECRRRS